MQLISSNLQRKTLDEDNSNALFCGLHYFRAMSCIWNLRVCSSMPQTVWNTENQVCEGPMEVSIDLVQTFWFQIKH